MRDVESAKRVDRNSFFFERRKRRKTWKLILAAFICISFVGINLWNRVNSNDSITAKRIPTRFKRSEEIVSSNESLNTTGSPLEDCLPRSVDEFPGNFLTVKETQEGGFIIHVIIIIYIFCAVAVVCDDYFCASLEIICDELNLQDDVAGATFMAAGSSAPEFFTAVAGVFIAKNDVGIGTILGSAVFNILFIIGACGLFAGMVMKLTWYPVLRDSLFYLLSIGALIIVIYDGEIYWYESLVLFLLYIFYIILMYFNKNMESMIEGIIEKHFHKEKSNNMSKDANENEQVDKPLYDEAKTESKSSKRPQMDEDETTFDIFDYDDEGEDTNENQPEEGHKSSKDYESPWDIPDTFFKRVYWVTMLPVTALYFITIPDCRRPGRWRKTFPLTFIISIAWIAGLSYLMVWLVAVAGDALGIPDTVMGLTLLAAGTSVPDCLASIIVARDGLGDMAVSNSIGSNVFDILVCLGIPWLLKTVAVDHGSFIEINSEGLLYTSITLLSTVVFLIVCLVITRWTLGKKFGAVCMAVYAGVITLSCLYELNVFGDFNLKPCPRE